MSNILDIGQAARLTSMSKILYLTVHGMRVMTFAEKRAWNRFGSTLAAYAVYVAVVLSLAGGHPLAKAPYGGVLLACVGGSIVLAILAEIAMSVALPHASRTRDARDREIWLRGEYAGHAFLAIGSLAALLMALSHWDTFWIANVIYLCSVLSVAIAQAAKIGMYRGTLPRW